MPGIINYDDLCLIAGDIRSNKNFTILKNNLPGQNNYRMDSSIGSGYFQYCGLLFISCHFFIHTFYNIIGYIKSRIFV
jgi:hypothetical protein